MDPVTRETPEFYLYLVLGRGSSNESSVLIFRITEYSLIFTRLRSLTTPTLFDLSDTE